MQLIHEATFGIPIVIKHCLGQIYEFHVPITDILEGLSEESNEVIKFSYSEVLLHLRKDDCYLQILILLEILNQPISARQIAETLELSLNQINKHIPILLNFQCVDKINVGIEEKYKVSNQIGLLAKGLIKENIELTNTLRKKIANNLTTERRMDYAIEEFEIIEIFNGYLEVRDFAYAEYFLKGEINKNPNSILLRYHYSLFLRDRKKNIKQAIEMLENLDKEISKFGKRDSNVLLALASSYTFLEFPNYEKAYKCYSDLLEISPTDQIRLLIGEFLVNWSTALKHKRELDPIDEIKRKNKIKDLAKKGVDVISHVSIDKDHHKYEYLISVGYFNQWNIEKAKTHLSKALKLSENDLVHLRKYEKFMFLIEKYSS